MEDYEMSDLESIQDFDEYQQQEYIQRCVTLAVFREWLHTRSIYNMPRLLKPSASNLRKFINRLNYHLNELIALSVNVMLWSNNFVKIVYSKFDALTKTKWDESFPNVDIKTIQENTLLEFLENTCQQYEMQNLEPEEEEDTEG